MYIEICANQSYYDASRLGWFFLIVYCHKRKESDIYMAKLIQYAVVFERQAMSCMSAPLDDRGIDVEKQVFGFSSLEDAREFLDVVVRSSADDAGVLLDSSTDEIRVGFDRYESGLIFVKKIELFW